MGTATTVEQIIGVENAMKQAAVSGNLGEFRRLKTAKHDLNRQAERETTDLQVKMTSRRTRVEAPSPREEKQLTTREQKLTAQLSRLQITHNNDLLALNKKPESDSLLSKLENCESQIAAVTRQIQAVHARQAQIESYHQDRQRDARLQQEARDQKSRLEELTKLEKKIASSRDSITGRWNEMLSDLAELDKVALRHMELTGHTNHCRPRDDARIAIAKGTSNAVTFQDGGRYPDAYVINFTLKVKNGKV